MLRELSEQEHESIGQLVTEAVEKYRDEKFWQEMEGALANLKADPEAWKDYQVEIALWDTTSGDGLLNEEPYYEDSEGTSAETP